MRQIYGCSKTVFFLYKSREEKEELKRKGEMCLLSFLKLLSVWFFRNADYTPMRVTMIINK